MLNESAIRHCPPSRLADARVNCHRAVQLLSCAARANRAAREDDSHASLVWDARHEQFLTLPLAGTAGDFHIALVVSSADGSGPTLTVLEERVPCASLLLGAQSYSGANDWLDEQLSLRGLKPCAQLELPYELPAQVACVQTFANALPDDTWVALSGWFTAGFIVLSELAERNAGNKPGVGPIWVWPHHFDMASHMPLSDGAGKLAPGIGVGLSPGDNSYCQPYLYVNPWPPPALSDLPEPPVPGHWHTDGFVGLVATADELLASDSIGSVGQTFTNEAVILARKLLGF